jgi:hypothetical protein
MVEHRAAGGRQKAEERRQSVATPAQVKILPPTALVVTPPLER